ncbi:MAG: glycosyltransferase family 4 protein [Candidatus Shapirobacteria bacterium]
MKILLVVPAYLAYSYVNQGEALAKGFAQLNIDNCLIKANNSDELKTKLGQYLPDYVIGVGNWTEYDLFVKTPKSLGFKCLPWIVSDEDYITKHVEEYNQHGLLATPSRHCQENLARSGINTNIIHIIPEAVDPDLWYPMDQNNLLPFLEYITIPISNPHFLNQWDMVKIHHEQIPVIYTTGGDATKKGAQEVIQALGQLDPKIPWIYMIKSWPGSVVFKRSIEELDLAQKVGIIDRIRYISAEYSQAYMRALMNICDIYAAPSRIEGFGLPHVEAQMCAKPVISLATTATEETVAHGQTGFHAKRDFSETNFVKADINDLSQCLQALITNSDLRDQMSQNALKHALTNFSPKTIAQKFLDLIQDS